MNSVRKARYLKALGIELWHSRDAAEVVEGVQEPESEQELPMAVPEPAPAPQASVAKNVEAPALLHGKATLKPDAAVPEHAVEPEPEPTLPVPTDWPGLRAMVKDCRRCTLCETRTQTVFGIGPENAELMVVGEGPGADEDASGEPFVGRAGKLLDQMLAAIGHSRSSNVFIANVVKCRPPGNRDPQPAEVKACRPYLEQQIKLVRPKLIVALGRVAAQRLLQSEQPLSKLRQKLHAYGDDQTPLLITYHPAYLLRSPREKAKSWQDLKQVSTLLAKDAF